MSNTVLVVGSSGTVGSELVALLKARGDVVRTTTSKITSRVNEVHLNLLTGEGLKTAFEGVDQAFFLSPAGYTNQDEILLPLIEQAKQQQIKKVVLMSAYGANASEDLPLRKAEIALENSGLTYNIIRPNWFYQNFNSYWIAGILSAGKILVPAGNAKTSFIDARDIAAVAAALLANDDFKDQAFDLTGPESVTHEEVAQVLSEVTGKSISYQDITPEELKANLTSAGLSVAYADFLNVILGYLHAGYNAQINQNVQIITGRSATGLRKYAEDYKSAWVG